MQNNDTGERIHDPTEKKIEQSKTDGKHIRADSLRTNIIIFFILYISINALSHLFFKLSIALKENDIHVTRSQILDINTSISAMGLFISIILSLFVAIHTRRAIKFSKLSPKIHRIDFIKNFKSKFGGSEFPPTLSKFTLCILCFSLFLHYVISNQNYHPTLINYKSPLPVKEFLLDYLIYLFLFLFSYSLLALFFESKKLTTNMKMTSSELKKEIKEMNGDPIIKSKRMAFASNLMLGLSQELQKCDVVIVNPTHFAVAIKWDRSSKFPPCCALKGVDHNALYIRKCARTLNIPIYSNPSVARDLYKNYKAGQFIRRNHFKAIAAAIIFADKIKAKKNVKKI